MRCWGARATTGAAASWSGTAGTGKSSLAAAFADGAACRRGARASTLPSRKPRRRSSATWPPSVRPGAMDHEGAPAFPRRARHPVRPGAAPGDHYHKLVHEFKPAAVVIDPITNLSAVGSLEEIKSMLTRVIDFLKGRPDHRPVHQPYRRGPGDRADRCRGSRR
jgi:circadian clock protein KaiC